MGNEYITPLEVIFGIEGALSGMENAIQEKNDSACQRYSREYNQKLDLARVGLDEMQVREIEKIYRSRFEIACLAGVDLAIEANSRV